MARIAGVDLPREKRVEIGLTYIYGIGRVSSNKILVYGLVRQLGLLADRLSVNIELPSQQGLQTLAPDKSREAILRADTGRHGAEQGGAGQIQARAGVRSGGTEHAADRRRYRRQRPTHPASDGIPVPEVPIEAGVLFRLCAGGGEQPAAVAGHKAASAAGAPSLSGGLAPAVLWLSGVGAAGRSAPGLRHAAGSQVQLGAGTSGAVSGRGDARRLGDAAAGAGRGAGRSSWHWRSRDCRANNRSSCRCSIRRGSRYE